MDPLKIGALYALHRLTVSCAILIFYKKVFYKDSWLKMKTRVQLTEHFTYYVAHCFADRSICCIYVLICSVSQRIRSCWTADLVQTRQRWRETEDVTTLSYPCCSLLLVQTERAFTQTHIHTSSRTLLEPWSPGGLFCLCAASPATHSSNRSVDTGSLNNMPIL